MISRTLHATVIHVTNPVTGILSVVVTVNVLGIPVSKKMFNNFTRFFFLLQCAIQFLNSVFSNSKNMCNNIINWFFVSTLVLELLTGTKNKLIWD